MLQIENLNLKDKMFHSTSFLLIIFSLLCVPQLILSRGTIRSLTDETWPEMLEGEWMVEFFAPWCPACQQMEPIWKEFAEWSDDLSIKVGNIDVTSNPGLSGRFMITTLPTIFHAKDGVFRQYKGPRNKDSFFSFIEDKKWSELEPVTGWKSPLSISMSTVSYFFKLSMTVRNIHNSMIQDYGIPYWGSYIIFGVSMILLGAVLGLIIVCVIDFVCPSKTSGYEPLPRKEFKGKDKDSDGEYEGEDIIKDDHLGEAELRKRKETAET